jgi:hypothetical protein
MLKSARGLLFQCTSTIMIKRVGLAQNEHHYQCIDATCPRHDIQTWYTSTAFHLNIQTWYTSTAFHLNIQTWYTSTAFHLNIQTKEQTNFN